MKISISFFAVFFCFAASASAGLKVYYLRHAQSGANAEHDWEFVPKIFRPPYVGNADTFSPHGKKQAAAVPEKLSGCKFDFIAVSPTWRTRQTILGFLQKNHRRGEIWPELEEFGIDAPRAHQLLAADNVPNARHDLFSGPVVNLPDDEKGFFTLRDNAKKRFHLRDAADERIADCVQSLKGAINLLKERGSRGDDSILLVGHATSGALLLHMLVKNEGELPPIKNAHLWMAEQQPDGSFVLKVYNDEPVGIR